MLPLIRVGKDSVTLSSITRPLRKYDIALYQRDNGKYILHRIIKVSDTITCVGDNQVQIETGLRYDQMIAIVSGFSRAGKEHSVNELGYKLYCRRWYCCWFVRRFLSRVKRKILSILRR